MNEKITYHQQVTYCGKPRCRKCRDGIGHGPYWYAYQTIDGQTTRTYIGKHLPPEVQATLATPPGTVEEGTTSEHPPAPSDGSAIVLRIWTLGQFRLERRVSNGSQPWQTITDSAWQQRHHSHVRSLLGYLLCSPERGASYAQISADLWPDTESETASSMLNTAIKSLRKILGHPSVGGSAQDALWHIGIPLVQVDGEWVSLAGPEHIWVDADIFAETVDRLGPPPPRDQVPSPEIAQQREQQLRDALALYNGDFLPEERDARWVVPRRHVLRRSWSGLLFEQVDLYIARSAFFEAIDLLDRLLAKEPTNELAVQHLIIVLARLKRRGEAFNAYKSFTAALQREHQAAPSKYTRDLIELVRQGGELPVHLEIPGPPADSILPPFAPTSGIPMQERLSAGKELSLEPIGRTHQSPLVGRDFELGVMRTLLLEVEQSTQRQLVSQRHASGIPLDTQRRPQWLLLMGDSGIGKTRLAEEMSREARQRGWAVVWGRLYAQESTVPYRVWTEVVRRILDLTAVQPSDLDPDLLQSLVSFLPELNERIPQAVLDRASPPLMLEPRLKQTRLWEAIEEVLKTVSESFPLLIVLDDIQWADESSHELLGRLARLLYGYPIMFIATCRDSELSKQPLHPFLETVNHMQRERSVQVLHIERLTGEQIGQLVSSLAQHPEAVVKHIQDQADGNPFFAEELARSAPPTLPTTVKAALDHRIGRLSKPCQQLLRNAAVLGGTFEFSLICAMESEDESGAEDELADEDTILTLLEEALQAGVLTDEGTGTRIFYHFWHPLLVSRLYELLSRVRRARLHLRAATILQRMHRGREEAVAATITDHLLKGDAQPEQIAHYAELAGNRAYAVSAYSEAQKHYTLAIKQIELAHPDSDHARLASLLERLAECSMIRGPFNEARTYYQRVLDLHRQMHRDDTDPEQKAAAAQIQALYLIEIAWTWSYTGDNADAWRSCEEAEQLLQRATIVGGPAWARLYYLQASLYRQEGRYEEALHPAQNALTLFEQQLKHLPPRKGSTRTRNTTSIQRTLEGDPINLGRVHRLMATIAQPMGQLSTVLEHQGKALAIYEQYNEQRQIAHLSCDIGYIHIKKAEYELARHALQRSLSLAQRIGDDPLIALVYGDLGELAAANDDLAEAESHYQLALQLAEERTQDRAYMSIWNAGLATVLMAQGKLDDAAQCIRRAWSLGRAIHNTPCIGLALVTLANARIAQAVALTHSEEKIHSRQQYDQLSMRTRLLEHAAADLQRALKLAQLEVETRTRGHLALAHVTLLQGRRQEAHMQIQQVIEEAQRYELAQIEMQARQLAEQISN